MDISVLATMKNVANCDKHCELQNTVSQQIFERILLLLGGMFASVPRSLKS